MGKNQFISFESKVRAKFWPSKKASLDLHLITSTLPVVWLAVMESVSSKKLKILFFKFSIVSGKMQQNCEVLVYIDLKRAITEGIKFYRGQDGVLWTDGNGQGKYFSLYIFIQGSETNTNRKRRVVNQIL